MPPPVRRPLAALAALCALVALGGCADTLQDQPIARSTLEPLVLNEPFPVYWLGASFRGLAVTNVSHDPGGAFTVAYGDCVRGGQSTCVPPLQIVTSPDNSFLPGGDSPRSTIALRGVHGVLAEGGATIELATGPVVVGVYANAPALARGAAQALAPINDVGLPGQRLPAALPDTGFDREPIDAQRPPLTAPPR